VPATLLGQLAIHKDHHGRGYPRSLLRFAMRAALRTSHHVGSFAVFTHPLDDGARAASMRAGGSRTCPSTRAGQWERSGLDW